MEHGLQQNLTLNQQLVMTPQLQQAIKLLELSSIELVKTVRQEMEHNPILEEAEETQTSALEKEDSNTEQDWEKYINEYNATERTYTEHEAVKTSNPEAFTPEKRTLEDHLRWQMMLYELSAEEEEIGQMVIGNLNRDGYLCIAPEEIARILGYKTEKVEKTLEILQKFEPSGVCARTLSESLLIQVRHLGMKNLIITEIIRNHLKDLENKNSKKISKDLGVSVNDVRAAANIIQYLEPKPGRQFSNEEPEYIIPDIYVYENGSDFKISLNDDGMPRLIISRFYRNAVLNGKKISKDTKNYLNKKMQSASWLIKTISQRKKTIILVMSSIVKFQHEFLDKGVEYLRPLTLKTIARDIQMHESTISRVTANKYAHTPQGIFELKYFFNNSIERNGKGSMASVSVKEKMRLLIEKEDINNPLSDEKITAILKGSDIKIARRTVAKYRKLLNILPSNKRKKL